MDIAVEIRSEGADTLLVDVAADDDALTGDFVARAAQLIGAPEGSDAWNQRTRQRLDPGLPISRSGLRSGDTVHVAPAGSPPSWAERDPTVLAHRFELVVVGGADAGRRVALTPGDATVGRSESCTLRLDDPDVSREHLHLGVGKDEVRVTDLGSTNGTEVDGREATGTVEVRPGQVIAVGSSVLALADRAAERDRAGNVSVRPGGLDLSRPPRVAHRPPPAVVRQPDVPVKPGGFRIPMSAALAPVLMGAVMAVAIGPQMLLFALMGPVMLLFTAWEDRRGGHALYRSGVEAFEREFATFEAAADAAQQAVLESLRRSGPDAADLVGRAVGIRADLWERRPDDADFLSLRVGVADPPTSVRFEGGVHPLGDPELAARVTRVLERHAVDPDVPLRVDLRRSGVAGVAGPPQVRDAMLRWWVVQLTTLHSPRDLGVAILCDDEDVASWDWARWLPHVLGPSSSGERRRRLGAGAEAARLLAEISQLIEHRELQLRRAGPAAAASGFQPLVVVLAGVTDLPGDVVDHVLGSGPAVGVMSVVAAADASRLPGRTRSIVAVDAGGTCRTTDVASGTTSVEGIADGVSVDTATAAARALAPLRDATAGDDGGSVPDRCLVVDTLELAQVDPDGILQRWGRHGLGDDLGAPIGLGARGPVSLDLRRDGPHGLAAGTTGAGKSEFLQSFVVSLAATYPPSKLTFVLVDYKGGAAFKDCVDLPHTVGFFTDLDAHLAQRALISLNAELRHREEVLREHGAKDLIDLEHAAPASAPPNLLIVFDEFAFLKREVPEFVAGVIDIAQRGRSLGVHLMLATQRPSGVVDDNIRANTNLRVALRMADESDSTDVIDRVDAAHIPRSIPGRAYVRVGHGDVRPVQTSYANARSVAASGPSMRLRTVGFSPTAAAGGADAAGPSPEGPTDLQRLVAAIGGACERLDLAPLRPPWLPALGEQLDLAALARGVRPPAGSSELVAVLGTADQPEHQRQVPWFLDLGTDGHCLVFGTAGAGKTTLLRSLATSLSLRLGPDDLHLYGIDMAGRGLVGIEALPNCGGVAAADEPERIERLFGLLEQTIVDRSSAMGGAGSLHEFRAHGGRAPYVVVMLDGFAAFAATYSVVDGGAVMEQLQRLIGVGRTVGVHFVITADRRNSVSSGISASVTSRIVMRLADPDEYASFGLGMGLAEAHLPPGRAFVAGGDEVQVAVCGPDASGPGQSTTIRRWSEVLRDRAPAAAGPTALAPLPETLRTSDLSASFPGAAFDPSRVPLGLSGLSFATATVDLTEPRAFLVVGPDRSGRSTALATLATELAPLPGEHLLVAPRRSPLRELGHWSQVAVDEEEVRALLDRAAIADGPVVLVVDDGDEYVDSMLDPTLTSLVRRTRDHDLVLMAAVRSHVAHRVFGGWIGELRKVRHGLLLQPDVDSDGDLFGTRLPRKAGRRFPVGRGYMVTRGPIDYVQVAVVD